MNKRTFVILTGRKGVGKDQFALFAKELHPDRVASVAIADWFKRLLADVTLQDLQAFYDYRKEVIYKTPAVLDERSRIRLGLALTTTLSKFGIAHEHDAIYKHLELHKGKVLHSNRETMIWFGQYVHQIFGSDRVHCEILEAAIYKLPAEKDIVIITDARTPYEGDYFVKLANSLHNKSLAVKITNKHASQSDAAIENSVDTFPEGYFNMEIDNPFPDLTAYKAIVHKTLLPIL